MTAPTLLTPPRPTDLTPVVDDATRRDLLKGAGALTLAGFLAACGETQQSASGPATRSIEHTAGTTQVPVAPRRVVALDGSIEVGLIALSVSPAAVNTSIEAWTEGFAEQLAARLDLGALPRYGDGFEPDLEAVAAARPEVVIGTDEDHAQLYDRLSQIAPTVLVERGGNGDWRRRLLLVADAVGRREEAAAVEADYEQLLVGIPAAARRATLAFARPTADGQVVLDSSAEGFAGSVAADAGIPTLTLPDGVGEVADLGYVTVSGERIDLLTAADLVVVPDYRASGRDSDSLTQFAANPLWAQLPAVRDGRVLQVPGLVYNGGNHYAATALLQQITAALG